jgi:hypothetical protein
MKGKDFYTSPCLLCGLRVRPEDGFTTNAFPYGWVHDRCNPVVRFFQKIVYHFRTRKWRKSLISKNSR